MNLALGGIVVALAGVVYAITTANAPLMVVAFLMFGVALGCLDDADDREYVKHSDALNAHGMHRLGIRDEDRP